MKNFTKPFGVIFLMVGIIFSLTYCTKNDQVLDLSTDTPTPVLNTDTLFSPVGTATLQPQGGPAWDGAIEGVWSNAPALTVHATVPDLGNGTFEGYVGWATDITMRSLHDANNIYFLVEFNADQKNVRSAQWYFNPTMKRWTQEVTNYETPVASTQNAAGTNYNTNSDGTLRPLFAQDQFTFMFNISTPSFNAANCYAACHINSSFGSPATPEGGVMYTNGPTQRLDCWRARSLQFMNMNQVNDCFIDDGASVGAGSSGTLNKNEVHGDWQVNNGSASTVPTQFQTTQAADGGLTNRQNIQILYAPAGTKETVPIWVIPNGTTVDYHNNSAILLSDTSSVSGPAYKVLQVDTNGWLYLSNGDTINPAIGTDYKQVGSGNGPKCIPGSIIGPYTGSRADVTINAFYTGSGWRMLFKRALTTSDTQGIPGGSNDVDFSSLDDQRFGVGAMFNGADNQHAIVAGLILHFKN